MLDVTGTFTGRQAVGPDARGRYSYGPWWIVSDPPPIPYRGADWQFWHDDYDGPGDSRCGSAASLQACLDEIDDLEANDETGAWITGGEALDRALASLDLELRPMPDRRPRRLWRAMGWGVTLTLVPLGLVQAVHLFLVALSAFDPSRIPQ